MFIVLDCSDILDKYSASQIQHKVASWCDPGLGWINWLAGQQNCVFSKSDVWTRHGQQHCTLCKQ